MREQQRATCSVGWACLGVEWDLVGNCDIFDQFLEFGESLGINCCGFAIEQLEGGSLPCVRAVVPPVVVVSTQRVKVFTM